MKKENINKVLKKLKEQLNILDKIIYGTDDVVFLRRWGFEHLDIEICKVSLFGIKIFEYKTKQTESIYLGYHKKYLYIYNDNFLVTQKLRTIKCLEQTSQYKTNKEMLKISGGLFSYTLLIGEKKTISSI